MNFKKAIAITTICCYCLTSLSIDGAMAALRQPSFQKEGSEIQLLGNRLTVSPQLGDVRKSNFSDSDQGVLIHIQDAHGVWDAQKSSGALLRELHNTYGVDLLLLEGGAGKLDPEFHHLSTKGIQLNSKQLSQAMEQAVLTGPEAWMIQNKNQIHGVGIEDEPLYLKNLEQFKNIYQAREVTDPWMAEMRRAWDKVASREMNPDLYEYLKTSHARTVESSGKWEGDWVRRLETLNKLSLKHLRLDLNNVANQLDQPYLTRYFRLRTLEPKVSWEKGENEWQKMISDQRLETRDRRLETRDKLIKEIGALFASAKKGEIQKNARGMFERLIEVLPANMKWETYPQLKNLITWIVLMSELDAEHLNDEAEQLNQKLIEKLTLSEKEKQLVGISEKIYSLEKLFKLELSRDEFAQVDLQGGKPSALNHLGGVHIGGGGGSKPATLDRIFDRAVQFYQTAILREDKMLQNAFEAMKKAGTKKAAIVTGGFHSPGLEAATRKANFAYVEIMPRIRQIRLEDKQNYLNAMLGEKLSRSSLSQSYANAPLITSVTSSRARDPRSELILRDSEEIARQLAQRRAKKNSPFMQRSAKKTHNPQSGLEDWKGARARPSARSEARTELPALDAYFETLPDNDLRNHRLAPAILQMIKRKKGLKARGVDLQSSLRESTGRVSRKIPVIEQVSEGVYQDFNLKDLPLAHRIAFAMAVYDEDEFPAVNRYLQKLISILNPARQYSSSDRLADAKDYEVIANIFWDAEQDLTTVQNIMLQHAVNKIFLSMPRFERRALEKEALIMEMIAERDQPGKGNVPQIVFITDYHGSTRTGSMIGHSLGLKNYQNIRTVEELEKRLAVEKIDITKKNILFIGGSDYVDRGPEPLSGYRFNQWLRKHGKLQFINGNHEWWKDWNILGMHLRVNDALRAITLTPAISNQQALEQLWPFVTTVNWSDAQIAAEKGRLLSLVGKFRTDMELLYVEAEFEDKIQKIADEIINAGTNPNHSLEWWSREWYEHSQWADVFLDQLNAELLNQMIQQIQKQLTPAQAVNLVQAIQSSALLTPPQQQTLIERVQKDGVLFGTISSESFAKSENVKKALVEAEKLKLQNALIREENEKLAAAGRHSEIKPQHKVATTFELTANEAKEIAGEIQHVVQSINADFKKRGIPEIVFNETKLVEPQNYRSNPVVMESALWDFKNAALMVTDIFENFYVHGIIPVTPDMKEFNVYYRDLTGVDAIERLQHDVRIFFDSLEKIEDTPEFRAHVHAELGEAFAVVNEWYSDILAHLKPANIRNFMDQGGPEKFPYDYVSATSARVVNGKKVIVHVGHVEAGKLRKEGIPYWFGGIDGGLFHGDLESSEGGYAGLGGYGTHFMRDANGQIMGVRRLGYEKTAVNYKKQIKKKENDLKLEKAKQPIEEGKIKRLEADLADLRKELALVEKTGDVITDLTLAEKDLNVVEMKKIEPLTDGRNMLDYYVIRFLSENIQMYQNLRRSAADRGLTQRLQYYEQKRAWSERKLAGYLEKHKNSINAEMMQKAVRSEMRIPEKPEWLDQKEKSNHEAIYGANGFLASLEHKIQSSRNLRKMLDTAEILVVIPIANEKSWARTSSLIDDVRRYANENTGKKLKIVAIAEAGSPTAEKLARRQDDGFQILYKDKKDRGKGASEFAGLYLSERSLKKGTEYLGAQAVVFLDADLKLSNGQESAKSLLGSLISEIENHPHSAMVLLHALKRRFSDDDGLAHFWTLAFTEALYGISFFQSHGGEFAVSREAVKALLESGKSGDEPTISVHDVYDLEHPLMLRLASLISRGKLPESYLVQHTKVYKDHTETEPERIFERMEEELIPRLFEAALSDQNFIKERPDLSRNIFYDIDGLKRRVRDKEVSGTKFFDIAGSFLENHFHELEPLAHLNEHPELEPFLAGLENERAQIQSAAAARDYIHFEFHPEFFGQVTRNALFMFASETDEERRKAITRTYMLFVKAAFFDHAATILKESRNALLLDVIQNRKDAPVAQAIRNAMRSEIRTNPASSILPKPAGSALTKLVVWGGSLFLFFGLLNLFLGFEKFKLIIGWGGVIMVTSVFVSAIREILSEAKKKTISKFEKEHELRKQVWDALDAWPSPAIETWTEEDRGVQVFDLDAVKDPYVRASLYLKRAARDFRFSLGQGASAQIVALNIRNNLKQALSNYQKASYDRDAGVLLNALSRLELDAGGVSPALIHFVEYFILARLRAQPRKAWVNAPLPSGGYVLGEKPANSELKEYPLPSQKRILAFMLPGETTTSFKNKPLYRDLRKNKNSIQFIRLNPRDIASREALTAKLRSLSKNKPFDVLITPFAGLMPKEQKQYPAELQRYFEDVKDLYELESGRPMDQIFYETELIPTLANYFVQGDEQSTRLSVLSMGPGGHNSQRREDKVGIYPGITMLMAFIAGTMGTKKGLLKVTDQPILADAFYRTGIYGDERPQQPSEPSKLRRIFLVSPHPDDDVIAAKAVLADAMKSAQDGEVVAEVIVMQPGENGVVDLNETQMKDALRLALGYAAGDLNAARVDQLKKEWGKRLNEIRALHESVLAEYKERYPASAEKFKAKLETFKGVDFDVLFNAAANQAWSYEELAKSGIPKTEINQATHALLKETAKYFIRRIENQRAIDFFNDAYPGKIRAQFFPEFLGYPSSGPQDLRFIHELEEHAAVVMQHLLMKFERSMKDAPKEAVISVVAPHRADSHPHHVGSWKVISEALKLWAVQASRQSERDVEILYYFAPWSGNLPAYHLSPQTKKSSNADLLRALIAGELTAARFGLPSPKELQTMQGQRYLVRPSILPSRSEVRSNRQEKSTKFFIAAAEALKKGDRRRFESERSKLEKLGMLVLAVGNSEFFPKNWKTKRPRVYARAEREEVLRLINAKVKHTMTPQEKRQLRVTVESQILAIGEDEVGLIGVQNYAEDESSEFGGAHLQIVSASETVPVDSMMRQTASGFMNMTQYGGAKNLHYQAQHLWWVGSEAFTSASEKLHGGSYSEVHRFFNPDGSSYIVKTADPRQDGGKLLDEARMIQALPKDAAGYFPKILKIIETPEKTEVWMEDLQGASLTGLINSAPGMVHMGMKEDFLSFSPFTIARQIYSLLLGVFYARKQSETPADFAEKFHFSKLEKRWSEAEASSKTFKRWMTAPYVKVFDHRGQMHLRPNFRMMLKIFRALAETYPNYFKPPYLSQQHGDLHFGNILVDIFEIISKKSISVGFKLIDPKWMKEGNDPLYDFAKLLHNLFGHYDLALDHSGTHHFRTGRGKSPDAPLEMSDYFDDEASGTMEMLERVRHFEIETWDFVRTHRGAAFPFEKDPLAWRIRLLFTEASLIAGLFPFHVVNDGSEEKVSILYERALTIFNDTLELFVSLQQDKKLIPTKDKKLRKTLEAMILAQNTQDEPAFVKALKEVDAVVSARSEARTVDVVEKPVAELQGWKQPEREESPVAVPSPQTFKGKYFVVLDDKTYLLESYEQMLKTHGAENVLMGASSVDGLRLVAELKAKGIADESIVIITDYQFRGEDTALNLINFLRAPKDQAVFKGPILIVSGSIVSRYEIPGIQDGKLSEEMHKKYGLAYLEKNGGYYFREQLLAALGDVIKNPVDADALTHAPLAVKTTEEMQIPQAQIYLQGAINDWEAALGRAVRKALSSLTDTDDLVADETKFVISKLRQIAIQSGFGAIDRSLKFERRVHDYKSALHQLLSGEMRDLMDWADKKTGDGLNPLRRELSKTESILKSAFHNAYFLQQLFDVLRRLDKIQKMEPLLQQAVIRFQQQHEGKTSEAWDPASGIAQGFAGLQNFEAELTRREVEKALIAWGRLRNDYKAVEESLKPLIGEQLGRRSSAFLESMSATINELFQAYVSQYGVAGLKAAEPGRAVGRIKILKGTEDQIRSALENLDANQIVVIDQDYSTLSAAGDKQSGIVFSREGAGHLATRARALGVPLIYLPNAIEMLPDGLAVVLTSENGKAALRPAAKNEMADAKALKKSRVQVKPVPVNWDVEPQMHMYVAMNTRWKEKASLEELSSIMGPKAARLFIMYRDQEQTYASIPGSLYLNFPFFKLILEANPETAQKIRQLETEVNGLMTQAEKTASLESVRQKLGQIQSLVADLKIPAGLQKEIREFRNQNEYRVYQEWEKDRKDNVWIPRLIARLSTNTEDLENDPGVGAGVYGSNEISADLSAVSQEDYLKIVMQTFASFWSWEAFADRRFYGIPEEESFPALVIQEFAGGQDGYAVLIHTADPSTHDANMMMIEMIPGSGRALTSPEPKLQGEPFRFYFDKSAGQVVDANDSRVHLRPVMATKKYTVSLKDGNLDPLDYRQYRDFSDPQRLRELVELIAARASKVETYFGRPMDMEVMIERMNAFAEGHPDYHPDKKVNAAIIVQARPQGGFEPYKNSRQFDVERKKRVEFIRKWIEHFGAKNLQNLDFYLGPDHEKAYGLGIDDNPDESRGMAETFRDLAPHHPYSVMPTVIEILMTEKEFEPVREGILRRLFFYAKWQHAPLSQLMEDLYEKNKDLFYQVLPYMIPSFGKHPDPKLPVVEWFNVANESLFARFRAYSGITRDMTEFVEPIPTDQLAVFINLINHSGYLMSGRNEIEGQLAEAFATRADKAMWIDYLDDDFRNEHAATLNRSEARNEAQSFLDWVKNSDFNFRLGSLNQIELSLRKGLASDQLSIASLLNLPTGGFAFALDVPPIFYAGGVTLISSELYRALKDRMTGKEFNDARYLEGADEEIGRAFSHDQRRHYGPSMGAVKGGSKHHHRGSNRSEARDSEFSNKIRALEGLLPQLQRDSLNSRLFISDKLDWKRLLGLAGSGLMGLGLGLSGLWIFAFVFSAAAVYFGFAAIKNPYGKTNIDGQDTFEMIAVGLSSLAQELKDAPTDESEDPKLFQDWTEGLDYFQEQLDAQKEFSTRIAYQVAWDNGNKAIVSAREAVNTLARSEMRSAVRVDAETVHSEDEARGLIIAIARQKYDGVSILQAILAVENRPSMLRAILAYYEMLHGKNLPKTLANDVPDVQRRIQELEAQVADVPEPSPENLPGEEIAAPSVVISSEVALQRFHDFGLVSLDELAGSFQLSPGQVTRKVGALNLNPEDGFLLRRWKWTSGQAEAIVSQAKWKLPKMVKELKELFPDVPRMTDYVFWIRGLNLREKFNVQLAQVQSASKDSVSIATQFGVQRGTMRKLLKALDATQKQVTNKKQALEFLKANSWNIPLLVAQLRLLYLSGEKKLSLSVVENLRRLDSLPEGATAGEKINFTKEFKEEFALKYKARYGYLRGTAVDFGFPEASLSVFQEVMELYGANAAEVELIPGDLLAGLKTTHDDLVNRIQSKEGDGLNWNLQKILELAFSKTDRSYGYLKVFEALGIRADFEKEYSETAATYFWSLAKVAQRFGFKSDTNLEAILKAFGLKWQTATEGDLERATGLKPDQVLKELEANGWKLRAFLDKHKDLTWPPDGFGLGAIFKSLKVGDKVKAHLLELEERQPMQKERLRELGLDRDSYHRLRLALGMSPLRSEMREVVTGSTGLVRVTLRSELKLTMLIGFFRIGARWVTPGVIRLMEAASGNVSTTISKSVQILGLKSVDMQDSFVISSGLALENKFLAAIQSRFQSPFAIVAPDPEQQRALVEYIQKYKLGDRVSVFKTLDAARLHLELRGKTVHGLAMAGESLLNAMRDQRIHFVSLTQAQLKNFYLAEDLETELLAVPLFASAA